MVLAMDGSHTTSMPAYPNNAYNLNTDNGNINNDNKDNDNNNSARCVRFEKETPSALFSFQNIYNNYISCRKRKRNTVNALKFEENLEQNLQELYYSLNNKTYEPRRSVCFTVLKPKPREIFAADFRDRIVHHIIVGALETIFEPSFSNDSFACRKNKGTHKAVKHLQRNTRKITGGNFGRKRAYFLQLDISNFFMSIDKRILFSIIEKKVNNFSPWGVDFKVDLLWITKKLIFHDPASNFIQKSTKEISELVPTHKSLINVEKGKGLPIGNHTSQFFANVYLHELDFFVKNTLRVKHYVRYVDDFILLSESKEELLNWFWEIKDFVETHLALNLKNKVNLLPISNGIDFLGYIIKPWSVFVRKRVLHNFKKKLLTANKELLENKLFFFEKNSMEEKSFRSSFSSYLGHFKHANNFKLKQQVIKEFPFTKMCF
ncbi:MAG: reverse transcriptase [Candidatus Diapherotrites archaeon]|uniref:Reverse transcriptase n=1 Tax=Candidatus Iainarchaeum sp. TaxID=3101447 RepID=A0A7K4BZZ2_9ARCH|nr:reverse transcriptase [Candidatus Diapherotrites archaeon]